MTGRPLRFLALVLGGWICARAAILSPDWWSEAALNPPPATIRPELRSARTTGIRQAAPAVSLRPANPSLIRHVSYKTGQAPPRRREATPAVPIAPSRSANLGVAAGWPARDPTAQSAVLPVGSAAAGRWSASAWLLVRSGSGRPGLTPGGTLGGSQAGARLGYRLGGGVSLSARTYAPLRRPAGAELAAGVAWRPAAAVPVEILAERRLAMGGEGRSAFSITASGGGSLALPGRLRLDLYGQAGIVGLRSRDAFVDASARMSAAVGPVEVGAGAWAGAQPGASRLDAGPALSWRLPAARANVRVEADWRFRIAGEASPGSGPALTLAADF